MIKKIIVLLFILVLSAGLSSCSRTFLSPPGFDELVKQIKKENEFVSKITMDYRNPTSLYVDCYLKIEKNIEEIVDIKDKLIAYIQTEEFQKSLNEERLDFNHEDSSIAGDFRINIYIHPSDDIRYDYCSQKKTNFEEWQERISTRPTEKP